MRYLCRNYISEPQSPLSKILQHPYSLQKIKWSHSRKLHSSLRNKNINKKSNSITQNITTQLLNYLNLGWLLACMAEASWQPPKSIGEWPNHQIMSFSCIPQGKTIIKNKIAIDDYLQSVVHGRWKVFVLIYVCARPHSTQRKIRWLHLMPKKCPKNQQQKTLLLSKGWHSRKLTFRHPTFKQNSNLQSKFSLQINQ